MDCQYAAGAAGRHLQNDPGADLVSVQPSADRQSASFHGNTVTTTAATAVILRELPLPSTVYATTPKFAHIRNVFAVSASCIWR